MFVPISILKRKRVSCEKMSKVNFPRIFQRSRSTLRSVPGLVFDAFAEYFTFKVPTSGWNINYGVKGLNKGTCWRNKVPFSLNKNDPVFGIRLCRWQLVTSRWKRPSKNNVENIVLSVRIEKSFPLKSRPSTCLCVRWKFAILAFENFDLNYSFWRGSQKVHASSCKIITNTTTKLTVKNISTELQSL